MNVQEKLRSKKDAIERSLDHFLPVEKNPLAEAMRYAVFAGGKRFRPLLALLSGDCFDLSQAEVLPFGCVVELIHNYSLVHDDLPMMDNDDFRRGRPSCHKVFGEDIALLAGDSLLTLAFEVLASAPWEDSKSARKERMTREIARCAGIQGMVGGQLLDITLTLDALSEDNLQDLMAKKTGALIMTSVSVGPILAGASSSLVQAMTDYGKNLGLAFQMRDDILDSEHFTSQDPPQHPNAASFYGVDVAKKKLEQHIQSALEALHSASIESEELRFLASSLLDLKQEK